MKFKIEGFFKLGSREYLIIVLLIIETRGATVVIIFFVQDIRIKSE